MPYAIVGVLALLADQALKYWAIANLERNVGVQKLIPGFLQLTYIRNYGAAFGAMEKVSILRWVLLLVLLAVCGLLLFLLLKGKIHTGLGRWSAVLLLAGALGNGIDRAIFGYVVDVIEFLPFRFPIFNIADCLILVFGVLFCVSIIFGRRAAPAEAPMPRNRNEAPAPRNRRADPFTSPEDGAEDPFAAGRVPARGRRKPVEEDRAPSLEDLAPARSRRAPEPEPPVRKRRPAEPAYDETPVRPRRPAAEPLREEAPVRPRRPAAEPVYDEAPVRPRRPAAEPLREETPVRPRRPVAEPVYDEAPVSPRRPAAEPVQAEKPAAPKDEFDLDSILAEFK